MIVIGRTKPERLAFMFGGKSKLAHAAEVSPSLVTRWIKRGFINPDYNVRISRAIAAHADTMGGEERAKFLEMATACLEHQAVCKCCGKPIGE